MPSVAEYIATRLHQLGVQHLFCVPGNYSAEFLLAASKIGIDCVGTTNELEAGYAADAYARINGLGVCSVTYGVGSQSVYNAIAGAYVEYCPVVLINGAPPLAKVTNLRNRGILFAHAIDPIRTDKTIFEHVTVASAEITSPDDAPEDIDRVLETCVRMRRPVYLEVHQAVWRASCAPPDERFENVPSSGTEEEDIATAVAVEKVLQKIARSRDPVLWGGEMLGRRQWVDVFARLVRHTGLPYTTTLMAKGLIAENEFPDQFLGVYDSKFSPQKVRDRIEKSDCIIALGTILSDFYADIATMPDADSALVLAAGDAVRIEGANYLDVPLDRFLLGLINSWSDGHRPRPDKPDRIAIKSEAKRMPPDSALTWDSFFERMHDFLTGKDLVLTDTGLAFFPSAELPIERRGGYLAQTAWLSIGWTGGATLGAALAERSKSAAKGSHKRQLGRPVVFVGDGGFQMNPQSFSTLVREKIPALVFVLSNGLYGIEQFLVDEQILDSGERFYRNNLPQASEFDILPKWNYQLLAESFGGKGFVVATHGKLEAALGDASNSDGPTLIAVELAPHDLPSAIAQVIQTPRPDEQYAFEPMLAAALNFGAPFAPVFELRPTPEPNAAAPIRFPLDAFD